MPKTRISEYSTTNSDNTDIESINIAEGCAPSGINNAIRELMVHLKEFQTGASGDAFTFAGGVLISGTANTITGNVLMSGTNTITGSTTATFAAGAVGTPSIAAHGDTNTGIFFPAADTIAFAEGGAEAMRIDSSGNVGIGTSSPGYKMDVQTSTPTAYVANFQNTGANQYGIIRVTGTSRGGEIDFYNGSTAQAGISGNSSSLQFYTNGISTTQMTIDSSGNVAIGNTSASYKLDVTGPDNTGGAALGVYSQNRTANLIIAYGSITASSNSGELGLRVLGANPINFSTNGTERARITSGGEVYIAGTTDQGAYNLQVNGTGVWGAGAYVNGSDARIKEDVAPIDSGLDVVTRLNPVTYRYKEDWSKDQSTQTGFIAQELLVALEGKNYVDGVVQQGGSEGYYSVAYQNIIPILTKAIQELKTEVDALKAELANK